MIRMYASCRERGSGSPDRRAGFLACAFPALALLACLCSCSSEDSGSVPVTRWALLHSDAQTPDTIPPDAAWEPVTIPSMFVTRHRPSPDFHGAWLMGELEISGPEAIFGLSLGRIYYTNSVYVNGTFIGDRAADEMHDVHHPQSYEVPAGALKPGTNRVLIRVGLYGREYGGLTDTPAFLTRSAFFSHKTWNEFLFRQVPMGIALMLLGQIIFNGIFFLWNRKEKVNLYAAGICLVWIFYILTLFSPWFPFSQDFRITFLWACTSGTPILFIMLIQSFYRVYFWELNRILFPALVLVTGAILSFQDTVSPWYPGRILATIALVVMMPLIVYIICRANSIKPDRSVYVFVFFGIFPGTFIAWDIFNYLWLFHYPPLLHTYTIPLFIIGINTLIIRDIIRKEIAYNLLYQGLQSQADTSRRPVITSTTEEKLEKVIAFIEANYTSDISREGLAAASGISPDHMSRMFKAYAGKRINDYINELRVRDAASRLSGTSAKIIEIAFAVGFDSLATFNRAFLKVMLESPTEYRKKNR